MFHMQIEQVLVDTHKHPHLIAFSRYSFSTHTYNDVETIKGIYQTKGTEHLNTFNFTISHHYLVQLQFLSYTYQYEERCGAIGCLYELPDYMFTWQSQSSQRVKKGLAQ